MAASAVFPVSSQSRSKSKLWLGALRLTGLTCLTGLLSLALPVAPAQASVVLLAGSGSEKVHSTEVVLLRQGDKTAVTVMPDYQGSLTPFVIIIPVPDDVTAARVLGMKREYVDHVESISAPRFAEFWEQNPCDPPGPAQQDWERDLRASDDTAFLGAVKSDPAQAQPQELLLDVKSQVRSGEYKVSVLGGEELLKFLGGKSLLLPAGGEDAIKKYGGSGYRFLVAEVDTAKMELVGGDRAQISPLRFWTQKDYFTLPLQFGLPSAAPKQELLVYTLVPNQRYQVTNYATKAAPTNLSVDFAVKERMGEFYANLHDRFLEKNPKTFLLEYAFPAEDCGKPCPAEPLQPGDLMTLGGDIMEEGLSNELLHPKPGDPTAEEQAKFDASLEGKTPQEKTKLRQEWGKEREALAARRALLARHKYVLSRLHYRYSKADVPMDPSLGVGGPVKGGVALPAGAEGQADPAVGAADANALQTRFNNVHPDISVLNCENPTRYRWGKAPSTYRGLRKTWVAEDLSRRNRQQIKAEEVVLTGVPELGLPGKKVEVAPLASAASSATAGEETKKSSCGCELAGDSRASASATGALLAALGLVFGIRRRQRSAG